MLNRIKKVLDRQIIKYVRRPDRTFLYSFLKYFIFILQRKSLIKIEVKEIKELKDQLTIKKNLTYLMLNYDSNNDSRLTDKIGALVVQPLPLIARQTCIILVNT